ncbi:MAG TPA: hypothetical protein PLF17_10940 [Chitinophagaceae bacterium]|nr:hypothetical protein [Chitinophagaceae bacterium]HRA71212.1 hypothetical protein [Flavobacterium sp.]
MILGIKEDFSSNVYLDAELTSASTSGLCLNSGVHPSITIDNLLSFLSFPKVSPELWDLATTYGSYNVSKKRSDLVTYEGVIYQSLLATNLNKQPDTETDYWMVTNMESLTLKSFIDKVQDRVYADLSLTKRLINSQHIYQVGKTEVLLPNDYAAWVFEPKGSDYVTITLNQVALQALTTDETNLYVINQGILVDTLVLTPNNGKFEFKELNYSFKGQGEWIFAIDSTNVLVSSGYVDPLSYDGFICYTATGTGNAPETATWSLHQSGNGLGFNVSASLDSSVYIENNLSNFGNFVRVTFELMALEVFLHNSSNRSNRNEKLQGDKELLVAETKSLEMNTVAKRHQTEYDRCKRLIAKTFDTQLATGDEFVVEIDSI